MLNLINEVLDISSIEAGKLSLLIEPIKVDLAINEILDAIQPLILEKQIKIKFENSPSNQTFVLADKKRLKQVLLNLIDNAIKYNNDGGKVVIRTNLLSENRDGERFLRIAITDSGVGISTEDIHKIFNPFERIGAEKTEIEGTGLGLVVVKKLIDAMKGDIGVESIAGVGSTFWIDLPIEKIMISKSEKNRIKSFKKNNSIKSGTILYVEDNKQNLELVQQILDDFQYNIQLIVDSLGNRALELAINRQPDLILLDLNLPGIHGSEILDQIQMEEKTKHIPVVIISADAMPVQIEKLLAKGAKKYLAKPIDVFEFLRIVDEYVR